MCQVTIAISTIDRGIRKAAKTVSLSACRNVKFLIVHQNSSSFSDEAWHDSYALLSEAGAQVVRTDSLGLAVSRNIAIGMSTTKYLIFSDDDVLYNFEEILKIPSVFSNAGADAITFRSTTPAGALRKSVYPNDGHVLELPLESAGVSSIEIAINVSSIRNKRVRFDTRFGLGALFPIGEETIFVADLIRSKLRVVHSSITPTVHPVESSGRQYGLSLAIARGAVLARRHQALFPVAACVHLAKHVGDYRWTSCFAGLYLLLGAIRFIRSSESDTQNW